MEYHHIITENDSFYSNWNTHYFFDNNVITGIQMHHYPIELMRMNNGFKNITMNTFNCETNTFTPNEELTFVNYENLKEITHFFDYITYIYVFDTKNKQYAKTSEFPYLISEIDGNYITSCRLGNKIYIFHSITWDYETGVFIFDIETNTFNNADFTHLNKSDSDHENDFECDYCDGCEKCEKEIIPNYTNKFIHLHKMEIVDCTTYENDIIINFTDDNETTKICKYNPETDELIELLPVLKTTDQSHREFPHKIELNDGKLFGQNWYHKDNLLHFYDVDKKELIKKYAVCNENELIEFWSQQDKELIVICRIFERVDIHKQIYKETHEDEFKTRSLQIKKFNIDKMLSE